MLASRCPLLLAAYVCMVEQRAVGEVGLSSLEIAVVDAVAARGSLKITYARGPNFMGRCVSRAKAFGSRTQSRRSRRWVRHAMIERRPIRSDDQRNRQA